MTDSWYIISKNEDRRRKVVVAEPVVPVAPAQPVAAPARY